MAKQKRRSASKSKPRAKTAKRAKPTKRVLVARVRRRVPGPQEIARDIDRRIAAYKKTLAKPTKKMKLTTFEAAGAKTLNLIAHGDSWFNYPVSYDEHPFTDITVWLKEKYLPKGTKILVLAHFGDAMQDSFGTTKRNLLIKALQAGKADAILFSGGGNDIIGENFHLYLNNAADVGNNPALAVNETALQTILAFITTYYRELVTIRDTYAPGIPIFLHGYDFARPTNRGVLGCLVGPWLYPALHARGWMQKPKGHDLKVGCDIVKMLLQRFDAHLRQEIAAKFPNVIVVATQGTVTQPGLWDNETHLKAEGFTKIAERFASAIKARFP